MKSETKEVAYPLGKTIGYTQSIKKVYSQDGFICMDLAHFYNIGLTVEETKKLIEDLREEINHLAVNGCRPKI